MNYLALLFFSVSVSAAPLSAPASALKTVEAFYKTYLNSSHKEKCKMAFSSSFHELLKKDAATCKKSAEADICGWGADGDVYLNAQDFDPKLTFKSAGFQATEPEPGKVKVSFNLFPHDKTQGNANQRNLTILMVKEKGAWVADDILTPDGSARKDIATEIAELEKDN